MCRIFPGILFVMLIINVYANAQRHEISVSYGGGNLIGKNTSDLGINPHRNEIFGRPATILTIAYQVNITNHISIEPQIGDFKFFPRNSTSSYGKYDYGTVYIGGIYNFRSTMDDLQLIPYVCSGVGAASDDFTELSSYPFFRVGAGIKYFPGKQRIVGAKFELRHDLFGKEDFTFYTRGITSFPSLHAGVFVRF